MSCLLGIVLLTIFPSSGSVQVSTNADNAADGDYVIGSTLTAPSAGPNCYCFGK